MTAPAIALLAPDLAADVAAMLADARLAEQRLDREGARAHYEQALHRLDHRSHGRLAAAVLRWIGRSYADDAQHDAALDVLDAALAVSAAIGDRSAAAHATNVIAITHWGAGDLDRAVATFEVARDRALHAGDHALFAMIVQNLGNIASVRGDFEGARAHFGVSLDSFRRQGMEGYAGLLLNNMGLLYTDHGRWQEAERAYAAALASAQRAEDLPTRIMIDVNRAGLWIARRDFDRAREACDAASEPAARVGDERALGEIEKHLGVIARERGDFRAAEDHLRRAREHADARQDLLLAAETAREEADLFSRQKRNRETLQRLNRAHALFRQMQAQRMVADIDRRLGRLEDRYLAIVRDWSSSIESADPYTRGHCERVAEYSVALAAASGYDEQTLFWIRMGALLHDVGKIVVPHAILNKPSALTHEEQVIMEQHPLAGEEMLSDIDFPWDVRPMVRHHHEQWMGNGYPDRLWGETIPLSARILCVTDVYDALTSDRPYRKALTHDQAADVMRKMDHVFDPTLRERFMALAAARAGTTRPWPLRSDRPSGEVAREIVMTEAFA
jgi:putative nucleotidyltransferase with HDIG domain